jgi:hypothetical protein
VSKVFNFNQELVWYSIKFRIDYQTKQKPVLIFNLIKKLNLIYYCQFQILEKNHKTIFMTIDTLSVLSWKPLILLCLWNNRNLWFFWLWNNQNNWFCDS